MATTNPELTSQPVRVPRSALSEGWKQLRTPLIYLLPALIIMMLITFYPLAFQVWMSFTDYGVIKEEGKQTLNPFGPNGTTPPNYRPAQYVGFRNYLDIVTNNPQFVARLGGEF